MKSSKFQENIIFARLKEKDKEAFVKAYDLYIEPIYRFIFFKVGDREEAQDLTSLTFLKTWNYILENSLKEYTTLKALIYKIARNAVIDHYRKTNMETQNVSLDQGNIDIVDRKEDLVKKMEISFDFNALEKYLFELKDEYREIIVLRFVEEFSIGEIAKILNKSKSNTRVLCHRALKTLKDLAIKK